MVKETGYGLVRYSKKTGKVDMAMTGMGDALLNLWALQNTTKTKETAVFDLETGEIDRLYVGTADGFPEVKKANEDFFNMYVDENIRIALQEDYNKGRD